LSETFPEFLGLKETEKDEDLLSGKILESRVAFARTLNLEPFNSQFLARGGASVIILLCHSTVRR